MARAGGLLPAIPASVGLLVFVRYLGRMDELQRRIQLDAIAFAAGAVAILTFSWGLLENAGFPHLSLIWVMPMMAVIWGLAASVAAYRYR